MSDLDYLKVRLQNGAISRREFMGRAAATGTGSASGEAPSPELAPSGGTKTSIACSRPALS